MAGSASPNNEGLLNRHNERLRMVNEQLRARHIHDERVLAALETVPRELFLPPSLQHLAYEDRALPIQEGQTISQPYMVAYMTEHLRLAKTDRVLEIGTGTGYQTAILMKLAGEVFTIERIGSLQQQASAVLAEIEGADVHFRICDGTYGWEEESPFDRIIVTAAGPDVPAPLLRQLGDEGVLVTPVGQQKQQRIVKIERHGKRLVETPLIMCRFVQLIGEQGWSSPTVQ